jgi:hypothetical protein
MRHQPTLGPGWGPLSTPAEEPAGGRLRRQYLIASLVLAAGFLLGLTRTRNGLIAIGLAFAVIGLLGNHRTRGSLGKALVEYAAVAGLVLAFTSAAPTAPQVNVAVQQQPVKGEAAEGGLEVVRRQVTELLQRARDGAAAADKLTPKGDR